METWNCVAITGSANEIVTMSKNAKKYPAPTTHSSRFSYGHTGMRSSRASGPARRCVRVAGLSRRG